MNDHNFWITVSLVLLLIALFVTDCTTGHTRYCPGVIRQHVYKPSYWTTQCHTDKDGKVSCHTVYHAEEFHLLVYIPDPEHLADLHINSILYGRYSDGAQVTVGEKRGHWSKITYSRWIAEDQVATR